MSILYDIRSGTPVKSKLYSNGLNISDTLIKGPLVADFTTGTYKANGEDKSFEDLFTFSRAGKAWLVKETGLQEYEADVPRFDGGLLIEQASTNTQIGGDIGASDGTSALNFVPDSTFGSLIPDVLKSSPIEGRTDNYRYSYQNLGGTPTETTLSVYMRTDKNQELLGFNASTTGQASTCSYNPQTGVISNNSAKNKVTVKSYKDGWFYIGVQCLVPNDLTLHLPLSRVQDISDSAYIALRQSEYGELSSYIKTTDVPVTRPADYLLNKITGTTVTGDWDSTLNLSIVNGVIVHSGYGRIRSLEIN